MAASAEFVSYIEESLGGNLIDVEFFQADYDRALDTAIRTWKQKGNNNLDKKFIPFSIVADQQEYDITTLTGESIDTIVRIIKPKSSGSSADPFYTSFIQNLMADWSNIGDRMAEYELIKQSIKTYERYMNYETQFIWKKRTGYLTLLGNPKIDTTWILEAYCDLTELEYEDHLWIREYALAEAKCILGRAYRKFQALSTPSGETALDGNELVQEGKDEKLALIENIADYVDGDPTGGLVLMG